MNDGRADVVCPLLKANNKNNNLQDGGYGYVQSIQSIH